jgi:hypothetical protein
MALNTSRVYQDVGTETRERSIELKTVCSVTARTDWLKKNPPFPCISEDYKGFVKQSFMT